LSIAIDSDRYPEHPQVFYLEQALPFLEKLEDILANSRYSGGSQRLSTLLVKICLVTNSLILFLKK